MARYVAEKVVSAIVTIFAASLLAFLILRAVPSNPARLIAGPFATDDVIKSIERQLDLDKPLPIQYLDYVANFLRGDWGFSYSAGEPVFRQIAERLPASVELAIFAFALAFVGALAVTVLASYSRSQLADGAIRLASFLCVGLPPFWISLILLVVFFEQLNWLPGPVGRGPEPSPIHTGLFTLDATLNGQWATLLADIQSLTLPSVALALAPMGYLIRLLRVNLLDVENEPFVTVLRAKGVRPLKVHFAHILPNAFIPTLTAGGLILAQLLGGSVLVESVFAWPGVGSLVMDGVLRQDYAVVQAFIMLSAAIYICVNLGVDVLYGYVDPRTRRSE